MSSEFTRVRTKDLETMCALFADVVTNLRVEIEKAKTKDENSSSIFRNQQSTGATRGQIDSVKERLEREINRLESQNAKYMDDLQSKKLEINTMKGKIQSLETEKNQISSMIASSASPTDQTIQMLNKKISDVTAEKSSFEHENKRLKMQMEESVKQVQTVTHTATLEKTRLVQAFDHLRRDHDQVNNSLKNFIDTVKKKDNEIDLLKKENTLSDEIKEEYVKDLRHNEQVIQDLTDELDHYKRLSSENITSGRTPSKQSKSWSPRSLITNLLGGKTSEGGETGGQDSSQESPRKTVVEAGGANSFLVYSSPPEAEAGAGGAENIVNSSPPEVEAGGQGAAKGRTGAAGGGAAAGRAEAGEKSPLEIFQLTKQEFLAWVLIHGKWAGNGSGAISRLFCYLNHNEEYAQEIAKAYKMSTRHASDSVQTEAMMQQIMKARLLTDLIYEQMQSTTKTGIESYGNFKVQIDCQVKNYHDLAVFLQNKTEKERSIIFENFCLFYKWKTKKIFMEAAGPTHIKYLNPSGSSTTDLEKQFYEVPIE